MNQKLEKSFLFSGKSNLLLSFFLLKGRIIGISFVNLKKILNFALAKKKRWLQHSKMLVLPS